MDSRLWGNNASGGGGGEWAQVLKEPLGANGYLSFTWDAIFFQVFIQYAAYHPYNATIYINFSSILCNIFSIFHCQMLHNVDKKLQNG